MDTPTTRRRRRKNKWNTKKKKKKKKGKWKRKTKRKREKTIITELGRRKKDRTDVAWSAGFVEAQAGENAAGENFRTACVVGHRSC